MILYELLTGQPAHDVSGALIAVIRRIADTELPSLRHVRPALDRDLESVVMKAVSPRLEDRYRTIEELGQDLRRFLSGQAVLARRHSRSYVLRKWLGRHRRSAAALSTIGCLAVAGDGIAGVRHKNSSYTTGIVGTAFSFDGKPDSAVYIPADDTLNDLTSGTIDAWINSTDSKDPVFETQVILYKEWAFSLFIKHGRVATYDWASNTEVLTDSFVADGTWHHIAMSFRSGVQGGTVLYVDGVEVATTTITINRQRPRGLAIGSWDAEEGSYCNFVGAIDEVHIWNRVLTPAEIDDLVPRNADGEVTMRDNRIDDGSFESMSVAAVSVLDRPTWTSWKFKGSSGIAYNDSPFGNGTSPDGSQVAYIQQRSEILSTFEVSRAGDYQLVLSSKGREYGGVNPIEVHVDGMVIATVIPSSNVEYTPSLFDLPNLTGGSHNISFKGVNDADATSFIDAVSLSLAKPTQDSESLSSMFTNSIGLNSIGLNSIGLNHAIVGRDKSWLDHHVRMIKASSE